MRTTLDVFSHQRLGKCLLFYNMIDIDVRTKQIISQSAQFINPDGIIDLTISNLKKEEKLLRISNLLTLSAGIYVRTYCQRIVCQCDLGSPLFSYLNTFSTKAIKT